jgi:predicted acyl esterase
MARRVGNIEVAYTNSNPNFHHWWTDLNPSRTVLPKGWQRDPDRLALKEDLIWEKDVQIPLRDGVKLRADIFRPAKFDGTKLPALLPWSPYGKTGSGMFFRLLRTVRVVEILTSREVIIKLPSSPGLESIKAP